MGNARARGGDDSLGAQSISRMGFRNPEVSKKRKGGQEGRAEKRLGSTTPGRLSRLLSEGNNPAITCGERVERHDRAIRPPETEID